MRSKTLLAALILALSFGVSPARADDDSTSAADRLAKAVRLYDQGKYEESRKLLNEIDKAALASEDDQLRLDVYLSKTAEAITDIARLKADLAAGDSAFGASRFEEARGHYASAVGNKFANAEQKSFAQKRINEIDAKVGRLVASDKKSSNDGQRSSDGTTLVDQLAAENALLWQQAKTTFRNTARDIRKAVLETNFGEARRLLDAARQIVEANRRYATPASDYEALRQEARDLEGYIENEQRAYDEQATIKKIEEINERERSRIAQVEETKQKQINELMDRARELQKERKLDEAVEVLNQVLAIDPLNDNAAWMRETLEDLVQNIRSVSNNKTNMHEIQKLMISTTEDRIPYHENIRYPKNWLEIRAKRKSTEELGDSPETVRAREKLKTQAPEIRFDSTPFQDVIEKLRTMTNLNIVPNWPALEAAAIEKDAEVNLRLQNVSFEKVLELVLDAVGAGEVELAFVIDDGVISISTREDLSRKTKTLVYNIQDLLITVPTFRGQQITLDQIGQQGDQPGGIAGGRFIEGGGGGAGGGGGGQGGMFGGGGQQDEEDEQQDEDPLEPIIDLIQATIDPESWREAGGNVGSISSLQQQLIVTQTTTAHNQLRDLLKQLRQARALQIAVEARYIQVSRNWVEQIGVDLDVVLNNGNAGFDRTTILDPSTNNPVLVPRQFTRNGFTPGAPGGVGITQPTQPFGQVYGQPGLVPAPGSIGPAWGTGTPIPIVNNTIDLAGPADTNIPGSLGSLVNTTPAFQIFGSFLDNIQVDFLLRASQVDRRSSELDAPKLVLFNGQRATFEKFIEQDYIAALTPVIGDNAGAFQPRVLSALTGRSLDVQATASSDRRYVTMTVRTFTQVTGDFRTVFFGGSLSVGSGFIELATRTTQRIRTTVSVPDGGTLLIGGLKQSGERDVDAGVPILSRIPILKRAYSNTSNVKDDQVLLILIKPTIIIQEEAEADAFPTLQGATEF